MAQSKKGRLNYRCPNCFKRDLDMDMFYDEAKGLYYCIRCCYQADEATVLADNEDIKRKYKRLLSRIDSFGDDNGEVSYHPYQKGEL